jgi:dTDP-4-amino-4,6-dideoxygalactose transaminase
METRYQNEIVGFNLRMTDIHAAIGRCQLKKLPKATEKRISNAKFLSDNLNSNSLPFIPEEYRHVFHQYTVRISHNRDTFSKLLKEKGVGNDVYYPTPVHKLPSFDSKIELFNTNTAAQEVLSLPVHPSLTKNQLRRIVDAFNRVQEEIGNV